MFDITILKQLGLFLCLLLRINSAYDKLCFIKFV